LKDGLAENEQPGTGSLRQSRQPSPLLQDTPASRQLPFIVDELTLELHRQLEWRWSKGVVWRGRRLQSVSE